ncbi:MAG: glutamate-5-semialdehyde dehydrogenase [Erysipelotrichaceae bacterium]|nr:glutamate-5-semialdehyde dehydrogenase [Erysipelotrichaceae bacterium]
MKTIELAALAKTASRSVRLLDNEVRSSILNEFADNLLNGQESILTANDQDIAAARAEGRTDAFLDRLRLTPERITAMAQGVREIAAMADPLGRVLEEKTIRSGVRLIKKTVPMGVIGIIFESRPNVTADCAALCLKAGSACILKGGKESLHSCLAITAAMHKAMRNYSLDENALVLLENPDREETNALMECRKYVDLLIPRGSSRLINAVVRQAKVPVIETGAGICHTFVDESADLQMADRVVFNAKCSRPSVCNAMETLLVHEKIAGQFLPMCASSLKEKNVIMHGDEQSRTILKDILPADDTNYATEYNDFEMNIRIVKDVNEAIAHIETFGTHHSDCIVTESAENVLAFFNGVDSACVYHNASTRFTDGGEFGMGAEIGISTQKLHARGPMGLNELTTYAYYLEGNGEIR